jgi:hypothetical protein
MARDLTKERVGVAVTVAGIETAVDPDVVPDNTQQIGHYDPITKEETQCVGGMDDFLKRYLSDIDNLVGDFKLTNILVLYSFERPKLVDCQPLNNLLVLSCVTPSKDIADRKPGNQSTVTSIEPGVADHVCLLRQNYNDSILKDLWMIDPIGDGNCGFYVLQLFLSYLGEKEELWKVKKEQLKKEQWKKTIPIREFLHVELEEERQYYEEHPFGVELQRTPGTPEEEWREWLVTLRSSVEDTIDECLSIWDKSTKKQKAIAKPYGGDNSVQMSNFLLLVFARMTKTRIVLLHHTNSNDPNRHGFRWYGMDFRSTREGNCTKNEGLPTLEQLGNNWYRTLMVMNNRTLIGRREDTIVWKDEEKTDSRHYTMWLPLDFNPQNPPSNTMEATQPASPSAKSILNPQTPNEGGVVVPQAATARPFSDLPATATQTLEALPFGSLTPWGPPKRTVPPWMASSGSTPTADTHHPVAPADSAAASPPSTAPCPSPASPAASTEGAGDPAAAPPPSASAAPCPSPAASTEGAVDQAVPHQPVGHNRNTANDPQGPLLSQIAQLRDSLAEANMEIIRLRQQISSLPTGLVKPKITVTCGCPMEHRHQDDSKGPGQRKNYGTCEAFATRFLEFFNGTHCESILHDSMPPEEDCDSSGTYQLNMSKTWGPSGCQARKMETGDERRVLEMRDQIRILFRKHWKKQHAELDLPFALQTSKPTEGYPWKKIKALVDYPFTDKQLKIECQQSTNATLLPAMQEIKKKAKSNEELAKRVAVLLQKRKLSFIPPIKAPKNPKKQKNAV